MTLPNAITAFRILLVPVFVTALLYHQRGPATVVFAIAALTDAIDGILARSSGQASMLGSYLDTIADKLLLVTAFGVLGVRGEVPRWCVVVVVSREIIVVGGWVVRILVAKTTTVAPTLIGKGSTVAQAVAVAGILLAPLTGIPARVVSVLVHTAMVMTVLSGFDYLVRGLPKLERGRG